MKQQQPTNPETLYPLLFELMGFDRESKHSEHYLFLISNHLKDNELDRPLDIQYTFCRLWSNLIDTLWYFRKTRTESIPLWLPVRAGSNAGTDSYFVYYLHQLLYLMDSNLRLLQ